MKSKILNAVKYISGTILTIGIITILFGCFKSSYSILTPIGIGTVIGAIFIFLIGVFFVATEEMLEKTPKGIKVTPIKKLKGLPSRHSF
ncbi:hypothetical protein [Bacillus sp. Marseille-P3661]|uniref:hypothetical protein n=1 Tax=Bacillus sp. Marseille-P3661 TaxID=1936234 RepID=UPI000C85F9A3|nr:hypothetical protein [Bacillus sp. Marseille-P3661]